MKDKLIVKKPDELIKMRGNFSEGALKLSSYLMAMLRPDKKFYTINVKEYMSKAGIKNNHNYIYFYEIAKELSDKQFEMKDRFRKKFRIFNFISSVEYFDGTLEIEFSEKMLNYLLLVKEKYLKYELNYILPLKSRYSIRLYEILKNEIQLSSRYNKNTPFVITTEELRNLLNIPESYNFKDIRRNVLERAGEELEKYTDISFSYDTVKNGKKVEAVRFFISLKKKENQKLNFRNVKTFINGLRQRYSGNGRFFCFGAAPDGQGMYWYGLDSKGYLYASYNGQIIDFDIFESMEKYRKFYFLAKNSEIYRNMLEDVINIKELYENNQDTVKVLAEEFKKILKDYE